MLHNINKAYWVVFLIIGVIVGVISGFIGPNVVQQVIFKHSNTFLVLTPFISNILTFIAFGFFILFCIGMIFENKIWNYIGILFLAVSFGMGYYASVGNYTLISNNDITFKKQMSENVYKWDEITEVAYLHETQDPLYKIQLTFENEKEEILEINRQHIQEFYKIQRKFIENNLNYY